MNEVKYILGEDKYLKFEVKSVKGDSFAIDSAKYDLIDDGVVEASGDCVIDEHFIKVKLKPQKATTLYTLIITYVIAEETLKHKVRIEVAA